MPQRDERVLEAEQGEVLLLVQRLQAEDLPVERLRALKVPDYQIDGKELLLPFSHVAPLRSVRRPLTSLRDWTARRPVTHRPGAREMTDGAAGRPSRSRARAGRAASIRRSPAFRLHARGKKLVFLRHEQVRVRSDDAP